MIYGILFSIFAILYSFTGHVNSQTCSGSYPYAPCSSNSACGCVPLSFTDEIGICAVLGVSCSRLTPCRSSDQSCESPNHICVQHSQCDSRPLCYPLALVDQRLCPPSTTATTTTPFMTTTTTMTTTTASNTSLALSTYSSLLNFTSPMYSRQNDTFNDTSSNFTSGYFFFEAIQLVVYESGFYNISSASPMDTFGYLYMWDFSPFNITNNLIASDDDSGMERQFSIGTYLQAGYTYIVVVTTFQPNITGQYELLVRGPRYVNFIPRNFAGVETTNTTTTTNTTQPNSVQSNIWWALTNTTEFMPGTNKHHHLFTLYITTSGMYNITSVSTIDTYGCLLVGGFNLTTGISGDGMCDDDSAGNGQFQILSQLEAGKNYTLLFTTFAEHVTGQYNIIVTGPDSVYMEIQNSMSNSTSASTSTSTWAPVFPMDVWSSYSDVLTNSSASFFRPTANSSSGFFFQAFELVVNQTGFYNLTSISGFDTIGYLYEWNFYPSDPSINMINQDDDGAGNGQFRLTYVLQAGARYILVATTFTSEVTGPFTVSAAGPAQINFIPLYSTVTVNTTMIPMTTTMTMNMTTTMTMNMTTTMTNTTESGNMTALYDGTLSSNSTSFIRPNGASTPPYYYQAVRVSVDTPGSYLISCSSPMDTFGYLYQNRFDPNYTTTNLMMFDDDSAGGRQFALSANLQANIAYIAIVTTYNVQETGPFSLKVSGPGAARLSV